MLNFILLYICRFFFLKSDTPIYYDYKEKIKYSYCTKLNNIYSTLKLTNVGNVFNNDTMIRLLSRFVEDLVGFHYIVYNIALRDLCINYTYIKVMCNRKYIKCILYTYIYI